MSEKSFIYASLNIYNSSYKQVHLGPWKAIKQNA